MAKAATATEPTAAPDATQPATPAVTATATATATAKPAKEFTVLEVTANIPVPTKEAGGKRGVKSKFPFEMLTAVGMSFGIVGRDAKSMSSIVSNANRTASNNVEKKDENGNVVFKVKPVKQADGSVINLPSQEPETVRLKEFEVYNVDPKTDPQGASCRVYRIK